MITLKLRKHEDSKCRTGYINGIALISIDYDVDELWCYYGVENVFSNHIFDEYITSFYSFKEAVKSLKRDIEEWLQQEIEVVYE